MTDEGHDVDAEPDIDGLQWDYVLIIENPNRRSATLKRTVPQSGAVRLLSTAERPGVHRARSGRPTRIRQR